MFCNPVFLPQQPQTYLEGPIPVDGVVPFSPVPGWGCTPPPPYPQVCYPVPPCPQRKEKTETGESDGSSKDQGNQAATKKKKTNLHQPPKLPAGVGYLFDKESNHTMLHVFSKAAPIWKDKYTKESLCVSPASIQLWPSLTSRRRKFKKFKVSVNFTVKMVIENVIQKDGEGCKSWAITEAIEDGDGTWRKVCVERCIRSAEISVH